MELKDFFFASKHAAGTIMPILLPDGSDSGEWLRVIGPACDDGVRAGRDYARAYQIIREELAPLDAECKERGDWSKYNAEMNWKADELNNSLALEVVTGWSFDEAFDKENLKTLLNEYKGLGTMVVKHFHESKQALTEK